MKQDVIVHPHSSLRLNDLVNSTDKDKLFSLAEHLGLALGEERTGRRGP
jgi:hypothetical protein